jgi:hypothetical protein
MTLRLTLSLGVLAIGVAGVSMSACSDSGGSSSSPGVGGGASSTGGGTGVGGAAANTGGGQGLGGSTAAGSALLPESGYIEGGGPDGRIWGAWYTFGGQDSVFTPPEGDAVMASGGQICFSGTVAEVLGGDYSTYYGADIGFDLCGMPGDMGNCADWMPAEYCDWGPETKHTVSECGISLNTISFDITGTLPSTELRINFKETGREESTYLVVAATGAFSGSVSDANVGYDSGAPALNLDMVESIHFQVASREGGTVEFDFCISNLQIT